MLRRVKELEKKSSRSRPIETTPKALTIPSLRSTSIPDGLGEKHVLMEMSVAWNFFEAWDPDRARGRCQAASWALWRSRAPAIQPHRCMFELWHNSDIASGARGGEGMALQVFISHTGGRHYANPNTLPSYVSSISYQTSADSK